MSKCTCSVVEDGKICGKPVRCRGWCNKHYLRWRAHGDPLTLAPQPSMAASEATFRARLAELDAMLLEPYRNSHTPHRVRCSAGHECSPMPSSVNSGQGICRTCAGTDPAAAEAAFRARVAELGGTTIGAYVNNHTPVLVRCAAGHDAWPTANKVQQGRGICAACGILATHEKCNLPRMAASEESFRQELAALGVTLLEPYQGQSHRHRARCPAGHEFEVWPGPRRPVFCKSCGRKDQVAAIAKFRAGLDALGFVLLEEGWLGARQMHRVRCAAGHEIQVWPVSVAQGASRCGWCTGRGHYATETRFRIRVAELGAIPLYDQWLGTNKRHHVRCANGHDCWPRPSNLRKGHGLCRACAQVAKVAERAEAAFHARLAELGATPLYGKWLGVRRKHHVRCTKGHDCYPEVQNVLAGNGVCRTCVGNDPAAAEAAFRNRLAELGAVPLFDQWRGNQYPHQVRCAAGHDCWPRPAGVQQGEGVCRKCRGKIWDAFYVVVQESEHRVKFGVTSGDARPRLADHRVAGYRTVARLVTGLPDRVAHEVEQAVRAALALAGEKPVRGREYFDASCLGLILDVADSWLASAQQVPQLRSPEPDPRPVRKRRQDALAEVVPLF